ncbi:MAG: DUF1549 and DUF1553 domain-containing protein [Pirellulaceae bacterium]
MKSRQITHPCAAIAAQLLILANPVWAEPPGGESDSNRRRQAMAERVDELLGERWSAAGVSPAPTASDPEFLRRVSLDLTGVIPRVAEVRSFLADKREHKRSHLIRQLLCSPRNASHLAKTWRQAMLPDSRDSARLARSVDLEEWLRRQFAQNMRYDRIVSDLLVTSGGGSGGPEVFFTALDLSPEKLAASTARIFLGLQIECAQCHQHPYDDWAQEDFWGYAAFFARLGQDDTMMRPGKIRLLDLDSGEVTLPNTATVVDPKYPGGPKAQARDGGTRRVQLAIWMASRDNPYLARAAVNRVWALLFGRGLVDPIDDLGPHNPPSHPELLRELTDFFVETGFDLRELFHTLAITRAYQLTSRTSGDTEPAPDLFARMAVKTLSADQLYDCLRRVGLRKSETGKPNTCSPKPPERLLFTVSMQMRGSNFAEFDAGLLQALTMLNGPQTSFTTNRDESDLLAALHAPFFTDDERVEMLFLGTLSRFPSADERLLFTGYLRDGGARGDSQGAVTDLLWALLNSAEFMLNH